MLSLSAKTVNLVGLAVAVGVLADDDPVAALALGLQLVGVVDVSATHSRPRSSQVMQIGLPPRAPP